MHKIRFTALTICFLLFNYISAQTIKIEQGVAVSSLDGYNVSGTDLFDENITPYQIAIGIDYCENKWWNLSSNIGFITKGGKSTVSMLDENGNLIEKAGDVKLKNNYVTLNTTFNLKYGIRNVDLYVGAGPRVDLKTKADTSMNLPIENQNLVWGAKCCAGMKFKFDKIVLGLDFSYLPNFNEPFKSDTHSLKDRTYTVGISVGYVVK